MTTIVVTTVLATAGAIWIAVALGGPASRHTGQLLYPHRVVLERIAAADGTSPDVVWLGDSTVMIAPGYPSYPYMIDHELLGPAGLRSVVVASPAFDFFAYWTLAGRVCALRPKVVVLVANFRSFRAEGAVRAFGDLTGEIDWVQVADAATLPYAVRGLTLPGILLARVLRTEIGADLFLTLEGLHRNVQDAAAWPWLGPAEPSRSAAETLPLFLRALGERSAAYDQPIQAGHPTLRFVGATVDRLARCGSRVIVLVAPIPWEFLAENGHYETLRFAARVATLEHVVVTHGGRLLDLHRALVRDEFRDADCHLTVGGAKAVADRVAFPIIEALVEQGVRPGPSLRSWDSAPAPASP